MSRSPFRLQYVGDVDPRLRREVSRFVRWLRRWYTFESPFELRLVHAPAVVDVDGRSVWLRWWQDYGQCEPVTAELAVGSFAKNLELYGETTAYPTVLAAIARLVKHYFQCYRCSPKRVDYAEKWADLVLDAYIDGVDPPPPWKGAKLSGSDEASAFDASRTSASI